MRARAEPFGAWVRLDEPPALVAVDHAVARRLRVLPDDAWASGRLSPRPRPLEVHLAVTERCPVGCPGCYVDAQSVGHHPSVAELEARLDAIDRGGAFTVAFGGGEPLLRNDLPRLAAHARKLGLVPVLTTSGLGLTERRAHDLADFAQVNVSYDGSDEVMRASRGNDGSVAERAIALLAGASVRVGINLMLTRFALPRLEETLRRARLLGASEAQLLRYKPAGRATGLTYFDRRLSSVQIASLAAIVEDLTTKAVLPLRIDCALLPFVVNAGTDPARLAEWGIFGCEAGRHLAVIRADGSVAGCSFSGDSAAGPYAEPALAAPALTRFEAHSQALPEPCASCPVREVCRGGCRVVADHAGPPGEPDPECPRVASYRAGNG